MAGDWIKFELATPRKPEVWQIAAQLNLDPDAVVGKLLRVWGWFDQQTENGNAPIVTKTLLDREVGVTGFCDAVISVGWMLQNDNAISLPNFDRHNGKTAKNRAVTAKRVAEHKAKQKSNDEGNGKGNDGNVTAPLPKEEKRREEVKNSDSNESLCPEPSAEDSKREKPPDQPDLDLIDPVVQTIPTNKFNTEGELFRVRQSKVDEYQATYAGVDVVQKLREMRQWCMDTPVKRKTLGGMPRFINTWLQREQNKPKPNITPIGGQYHATGNGSSGKDPRCFADKQRDQARAVLNRRRDN